jgi:hypothetical protein
MYEAAGVFVASGPSVFQDFSRMPFEKRSALAALRTDRINPRLAPSLKLGTLKGAFTEGCVK